MAPQPDQAGPGAPGMTRPLSDEADVLAPDGSEVRFLATAATGSMAEFRLPPGAVARAIRHRTVTELWFVLAGQGRIWRAGEDPDSAESVTPLEPGISLSIPPGTRFQFRADGTQTLRILGTTMPPWPGPAEAVFVDGPWQARLSD